MKNIWIFLGSVFGFIAVAIGAFGAHALQGRLEVKYLEIYKTAAQYQFYHALALVLVGAVSFQIQTKWTHYAGVCFTAGIILFSCSLYALALTEYRPLGAITPIGGVLFLLGWFFLALSAWV